MDENLDDFLIGCFSTDDEDPTHNHTYTLQDDFPGRFVVFDSCLYTSATADFNYEMLNEINVTVRSADDGKPSLYREELFTITILDVNEHPSIMTTSHLKVN